MEDPSPVAGTSAPAVSTPNLSDPLQLSRFHIVALAFQRAKQLKNGARPRVDPGDHKPTRVALLEVMADTISWTVDPAVGEPELSPAKS